MGLSTSSSTMLLESWVARVPRMWLKKWLNFWLLNSTRKTYQGNQARFAKLTRPEKRISTNRNGLQIRYGPSWPGIASRWLFFLGHYSCYGPLVTTVATANDLVPAKHSPGKDNACYSFPPRLPNQSSNSWTPAISSRVRVCLAKMFRARCLPLVGKTNALRISLWIVQDLVKFKSLNLPHRGWNFKIIILPKAVRVFNSPIARIITHVNNHPNRVIF